ncbi:DNA ligase (ATP) [Cladophialophora chaetospira]|uniref:DNA ligase n=1 Tax=Cladophialophora chaetospira TaxID=386627 RepID=A0AA38X0E1_9EURO|nr:DNA ligase (ATP) [Cladophialophora chaetospira]
MSQDSSYGSSQRSMKYQSREEREAELDREYPKRPHNHGKSRPFHTLFQELFNPLIDIRKNKTPGAVVNRRKVGPDGQSNKTPSERRDALILRYIGRWRKDVGPDFFPAFRLIIPDKDRDRGVYGLKEKAIAKLLINVMKIDKNSDDGYNLLNWKNPSRSSSSTAAGDFAERCHEALAKRPMRNQVGDMTIDEVNEQLDKLAAAPKEQDQLPILADFYKRMNAEELKWLIQIILKQMKVGATERTFFSLWHEDAEALFNVSSNLRRVCWELHDPNVRLESEKAGVALGQCFQPMLAAGKSEPLKKVVEALRPTEEDPEFWIEEKLDGERMQMHMETDATHPGGKKFRFWSRKAKDYTYLYGNGFHDTDGALTQSIKDCFAEGVENLILDGEMITWDPTEKAPVPFGTLKTAALAEQRNPFGQGHRPVFRIFDILYLNDQPLTRYELRDRRKALAHSVISKPERFEIHDYIVATKVEEVEDLLRRVVEEASEGLVLKNPRSMYRLDDRSGDWQKVKPEYMEGYGEELDCVIIGGYYGSGKRGGSLSSFLCGLRASRKALEVASQRRSQSQDQSQQRKGHTQPRGRKASASQRYSQTQSQSQSQSQSQAHVPDSQPMQVDDDSPVENFTTFFKVGGGMTANDYAAIRHATDGKWHRWDSRRPAAKDYIDQGDFSRLSEKPDMWIKPSDSLVVQVKAAQVTPSEDYGFGATLRFPRFVRIRRDRDWTSALSIEGFHDLKAHAVEEEKKKKMQADEKRKEKRKARVGGYPSRKKTLTVAGYNARDVNAVKLPDGPQGNVFEGLTFYIMTESSLPGQRKKTKLELEALVKANGGRIVQTPTLTSSEDQDSSVICIASRRTVKVASLEKRGQQEIIKPIWIFDCIDQAKQDFDRGFGEEMVVPFEPERHLFFLPEETKDAFEGNVDEYGDSFARDTTEDELREIMDKMGTVDVERGEEEKIPELFDDAIFKMRGFLFHGMMFYFDTGTDPPVKKVPEAASLQLSRPSNANAEQDAGTLLPTPNTTTSLKSIAAFAGAQVLPHYHSMLATVPTSLKPKITHVIAHPASDLPSLRKELARWKGRKIPRIVTREWIEVCWKEGTRVDEEKFVAFKSVRTERAPEE